MAEDLFAWQLRLTAAPELVFASLMQALGGNLSMNDIRFLGTRTVMTFQVAGPSGEAPAGVRASVSPSGSGTLLAFGPDHRHGQYQASITAVAHAVAGLSRSLREN